MKKSIHMINTTKCDKCSFFGQNASRTFVRLWLSHQRENAHILEKIGGDWTPAKIRGTLKNRGWGASMGYPGLVLDRKDQLVTGFVFTSSKLKQHWEWLDDFEGSEYKRVQTRVFLDTGSTLYAFAYMLRQG